MRPRHKAAENQVPQTYPAVSEQASMRPRHKAAENRREHDALLEIIRASMRPRHKAAENAGLILGDARRVHGLQ